MNTYQVGDRVAIVHARGTVCSISTVTAVKELKRDTKVTTSKGAEWSANSGQPWESRTVTWYTGSVVTPLTPELLASFKDRRAMISTQRAVEQWSTLTQDERDAFAEIAARVQARLSA